MCFDVWLADEIKSKKLASVCMVQINVFTICVQKRKRLMISRKSLIFFGVPRGGGLVAGVRGLYLVGNSGLIRLGKRNSYGYGG